MMIVNRAVSIGVKIIDRKKGEKERNAYCKRKKNLTPTPHLLPAHG